MLEIEIDNAAADTIRARGAAYSIDRIVIHTMEGTLAGTRAWFKKAGRKVPTAAHFLVGRDGKIVQMAPVEVKLLHAGSKSVAGWNDRSIGIELEAWTGTATPPSSIKFPRDDFPEVLLQAAAQLVDMLTSEHSIPVTRSHILGHREIVGTTHVDPGEHFPWDDFLSRVRLCK